MAPSESPSENRTVIRITAILLSCSLTGCGFVEASRKHLDPTLAFDRFVRMTRSRDVGGRLARRSQSMVVKGTRLVQGMQDDFALLPSRLDDVTADASTLKRRLETAFHPDEVLRRWTKGLRKLQEREGLWMRSLPSDATDPERQVSVDLVPAKERRTLFGRLIDRFF